MSPLFRMFSRSGSVVQCSMIGVPVASATSRAVFSTSMSCARSLCLPLIRTLTPMQAIAVVVIVWIAAARVDHRRIEIDLVGHDEADRRDVQQRVDPRPRALHHVAAKSHERCPSRSIRSRAPSSRRSGSRRCRSRR